MKHRRRPNAPTTVDTTAPEPTPVRVVSIEVKDDPPLEMWRDAGTGLVWVMPQSEGTAALCISNSERLFVQYHERYGYYSPSVNGYKLEYDRPPHDLIAVLHKREITVWAGGLEGAESEFARLRKFMAGVDA